MLCCTLKFLNALEIHQDLLAHALSGAGSPKNNRENLKFGLKFSLLESITSGLVGLSSRNFISRRAAKQGYKMGTIFTMPPPQKKINRENLKFALKFSLLESITSGLVGLSSRNFFSRRAMKQG